MNPQDPNAPLQPKPEPMDQSEQQNAGGEAVKQEQTPSGPPTTETKMEVDAPATAVKEEKMEVDGAESEKEKEKVKEEEKEEDTRPKILLSGMENSQRKQRFGGPRM